MLTTHTTRRGFATRLAALLPSLGIGRVSREQEQDGVQKLDAHGKPSDRKGFITPLIIHNGLIYIAGQGAHSQGDKSAEGKPPTIELHTKMVMEGVKSTVEAGGGTMDSILQLTVYLAKLEYYEGMN